MSRGPVRRVQNVSCASIPLEALVGEDGDQTIGEHVPDDALELRYSLRDDQPRTLEEAGRTLGMTRERARQLEARALRALRAIHEQTGSIVRVSGRYAESTRHDLA
jgi:DNA-directed RNA polymerase sigma subunit (sigma70/sigma32)